MSKPDYNKEIMDSLKEGGIVTVSNHWWIHDIEVPLQGLTTQYKA